MRRIFFVSSVNPSNIFVQVLSSLCKTAACLHPGISVAAEVLYRFVGVLFAVEDGPV
jgi:hypothetical protein